MPKIFMARRACRVSSCSEPKKGLAKDGAVDFLIDTLKAARPHGVTAQSPCWGRRPTWALALIQEPESSGHQGRRVIMGGAHFNGGNVAAVGEEVNLFADPHAAEVVLRVVRG